MMEGRLSYKRLLRPARGGISMVVRVSVRMIVMMVMIMAVRVIVMVVMIMAM